MTFKVCNHGSKYPYLLHKIGFVDSQFGTTVLKKVNAFEFPTKIDFSHKDEKITNGS